MIIPNELKTKKIRFIKIQQGKKRPEEKDWQGRQNYKFDNKKFQEYLEKSSACGVLCGKKSGNLFVLDCDRKELASDVLMGLPATFVVKTGSTNGHHFYYFIPDLDRKIVLTDNKGVHWGEVQGDRSQVICPNSTHPNGNIYKVIQDNKIATITKDQLLKVIKPYRKEKKINYSTNNGFDLDIAKVANTISGLDMTTEGLQGANPQHGSKNGGNLCINLDKGTWFCHRCLTGGDALYLIALVENLIPCAEIQPGYFKSNPDIFKKVLNIAREKYGYNIPEYEKRELVPLFVGEKTNQLNVQGIVEHIEGKYKFITIRDKTSRNPHIYIYEDGFYQLNGDTQLIKIIKNLFNNLPWKSHYEREIMHYIETENIVDRDEIHPPKNLINLGNGIYNLETEKLEPHSNKYYFLYKIPVNYSPNAKCPKIMNYFNSTLKSEYVKLSQEIFGYCLYSDYPIHGIIYLFGKGGNGKSVYTNLLANMLGNDNVASKEINNLMNNRFASSCLYGKLANICGELSAGVLKNTDMIKRLSAGDSISAEFKGKDAFDFYNRAKVLTACNEIPVCEDTSDGWIERQYIIPFLKKFRRTKEDDIHLKTKLIGNKGEMEGLLLWALEGLKRLLETNQFSYDYDMEARYLMYQQNSKYFLERYYVKGNFDDFAEVQDIREEYTEWCKENDVPEDSDTSLARKLTKEGYVLDRVQKETEWIWVRRYLRKV